MPWKERYTTSDEKTLDDKDVRWPNAARCAVRIVVDLGMAHAAEGLKASDFDSSEAVFALGEGLDLLLAVLDRHAMKVTFAVPGWLAVLYRERIQSLHRAGHEIAVAGLKGEDAAALSRDEETSRIEEASRLVADIVGERPVGWFCLPRGSDPFAVGSVSANTVDLLIDAGYQYIGNGLADDIPYYWVTDAPTRRALLALPYYYHFNDLYFIMYPRKGSGIENGDVLLRNWLAEFDAQYQRGRHFEMTLHPEHAGWSNRLRGLDNFLSHVRERQNVWSCTSAQCAAYWQQTYPAEETLKLAPSIWQDHEGSLS